MKKTVYFVALMSEISLVATMFILESFAEKKAGVNHHVLARRHQWETTVFSPGNKDFISFALAFIFAGFLALLVYSFIKRANSKEFFRFRQIQILIGMLAAAFALMSQHMMFFLDMKITPYITFSAMVILGIQLIVIALSGKLTKEGNNLK